MHWIWQEGRGHPRTIWVDEAKLEVAQATLLDDKKDSSEARGVKYFWNIFW